MAAAVACLSEALLAVQVGKLCAQTPIALGEAPNRFIEGAQSGEVSQAVRIAGTAEQFRLVPNLGARRLADVKRADLQALVERMKVSGKAPSTIRNAVNAEGALIAGACNTTLLALQPIPPPASRFRRSRG
jgi:hypothetical protein